MNHSELSHMAGAVDDSTINIVVVIIIIIITMCYINLLFSYLLTYGRVMCINKSA